MKRFTLRQLALACALCAACTAAVGLSMRPGGRLHAAARVLTSGGRDACAVDHNAYLIDRDAFYQSPSSPDVQKKRLDDQAKLLEAYERDPAAFVKEYQGADRLFLFDAVIDAENLVRVGTFGDGGKWVSDPLALRAGAVVYSFGVGGEISFDAEMAGLFGCEVHAFDPTPSVQRAFAHCQPGQPVGKGSFSYHAVGLGPTSLQPGGADELVLEGRKCPVKRLGELAAELGHAQVDIVKLDIDGGEWAALPEILSSGTLAKLSVKQLLVEFHLAGDENFDSFARIIGQLRRQGYLIFRKEFNPRDAERCAEFAFLHVE